MSMYFFIWGVNNTRAVDNVTVWVKRHLETCLVVLATSSANPSFLAQPAALGEGVLSCLKKKAFNFSLLPTPSEIVPYWAGTNLSSVSVIIPPPYLVPKL